MIAAPYLGQPVRFASSSSVAHVSRWAGSGATMRVWIRYAPNVPERCHWAHELDAVG